MARCERGEAAPHEMGSAPRGLGRAEAGVLWVLVGSAWGTERGELGSASGESGKAMCILRSVASISRERGAVLGTLCLARALCMWENFLGIKVCHYVVNARLCRNGSRERVQKRLRRIYSRL
jgi:hypothetical protein